MLGSWSDRLNTYNNFDLYELFSINPDKSDECDPDLMLCNPCSDYYSISKLNKMLINSDPKSLSILEAYLKILIF